MTRRETKNEDCSSIDTDSTCDSSSIASVESSDFDNSQLLQVIQILMLPNVSFIDLELTSCKDKDISELFLDLLDYFVIDLDSVSSGFGKIIHFINGNRKLEKI